MSRAYTLPSTFSIDYRQTGILTFQLRASQVLPVAPDEVFTFFEDPRNLFEITPDWLDFKMVDSERPEVFEGVEFDYTIRWLGLRLKWRSRIVDHKPPDRFTDIQICGPYRYWRHLHTFEEAPEGTLMKDQVRYRMPLLGIPIYRCIIKRQLEDIFCYRAIRIDEWSRGEMKPKGV